MFGLQRKLRNKTETQTKYLPVMPGWSIWAGSAVLLIVGTLAVWILLSLYGSGSPQDKIKLEIIKLAGSIVVGTGGAVALFLAARRQRTTELDLFQKERNAVESKYDADERRVTEIYAAAAEQLGSDKAPVRMAGLYALEHLAQNNPSHRQTIVDLLCAYLRMPFSIDFVNSPGSPGTRSQARLKTNRIRAPRSQDTRSFEPVTRNYLSRILSSPEASIDSPNRRNAQELEVRATAQNLLAEHLNPRNQSLHVSQSGKFWKNIDLNLSGAVLFNWKASDCHIRNANFDYARLFDGANFNGTHFHGRASFVGTKFFGIAGFRGAKFFGDAEFETAELGAWAIFSDVDFGECASFTSAQFGNLADFRGSDFRGELCLSGAQINSGTTFLNARFHESVVADGIDANARPFILGSFARFDNFDKWKNEVPGWNIFEEIVITENGTKWGILFPSKSEVE